MTNNTKSRYWTFELYLESAPYDWKELLNNTFLPIAYIIHDKDLKDDGFIKKEHAHVFVQYGNSTTYKNIYDIFGNIAANGHIERVISPKGAFDYLTHKNRPEKYQYSDDDVVYLNGFDISSFADWSPSEKIDNMRIIMSMCNTEKIYEYSSLLEYFALINNNELLKFCMFNTVLVNTYITSFRHRNLKNITAAVRAAESGGVND